MLLESQLISFKLLLYSCETTKKIFFFAEADTDSEGNELKVYIPSPTHPKKR